MSDRDAITALVHSYASLLDRGEMDAVAALFEHATWRSEPAGTSLRGSTEVREVYDRLQLHDGSPRTRHLITNLTIDLDPAGLSASSHCYWTVLQEVPPNRRIDVILSGQYIDRFEKVDASWRFADRLIVVDLTGDTSGHTR